MRQIFLIAALFMLFAGRADAQRLAIGDRAPEMKVSEWLTSPYSGSGTYLVEFFFSGSKPSVDRLKQLDAIASAFAGKVTVVVIAKEDKAKVVASVPVASAKYKVAIDDNNKTFDSYGIQFVPYCVLVDGKGRILWFGNSTALTEQTISKYL